MNAPSPITAVLPTVSLECQENGSDKEYHVQVVAKDDGFVVNFQYGRIGNTLTPGCKTPAPVPLEKANKIFEKLVAEKKAKGYRYMGASTASIDQVERRDSGLRPQLLNTIPLDDATALINDPEWGMQEKKDGKRIMLYANVSTNIVVANNKLGQVCPVPIAVVTAALTLPVNEVILDGELIGDVFHVFDIVQLNGKPVAQNSYLTRYSTYIKLLTASQAEGGAVLVPVLAYFTTAEKKAAFDRIKADGGEGVVFKLLSALYVPGRPNSGGDQLKFKFTESASVLVGSISDSKRSIGIVLLALDGTEVSVGNCTIPPNHRIPQQWDIVEVRYLYRYGAEGDLFQPVFLGPRDDILREECVLTQITRVKV